MRAQIDEIGGSPALRAYGFALSLTHLLTLVFWGGGTVLARHVADPVTICWPVLPACRDWAAAWEVVLAPMLCAYAVVTLVTLFAWARGRARAGYVGLGAAFVLKTVLLSVDYRAMGNYHYMAVIVTALFLFVPRKVEVIRAMIVAFYLGAGVLKFNREWLSGAALFGQPWLTGRWLVLGCGAVVALEMIGSFGLLARDRRVFWSTFVAFVGFHLFSWHIVGFFYPTVMFALLAIFPLARRAGESELRPWAPTTFAALGAFAVMQLPPAFSRTDSALTGENRLFALNMFDARIRCHAQAWIENRADDATIAVAGDPVGHLGTRIRCEPWVYREYARSLCATGDARSVTLRMLAKRTSDVAWMLTLDETVTCATSSPPTQRTARAN